MNNNKIKSKAHVNSFLFDKILSIFRVVTNKNTTNERLFLSGKNIKHRQKLLKKINRELKTILD